MKYLLDTCIVSELIKKTPEPNVIKWIDSMNELDLYLSVISFGEIQKGISRLDDVVRKHKIQLWMEDLKDRFKDRIIDLDLSTMLMWGETSGEFSKRGINIPSIDSLLGASAKNNQLCLVTRNTDDFKYCGIELFNPWK
ncbi:MAG: type II toxin-antitoxin system VapC family toxin [Candidatus Marinimicrobia bacterium]|nr:type II toxin-antitoxin system VapC family toxin [Candidatus Neomarinimicrobiota bacterium]